MKKLEDIQYLLFKNKNLESSLYENFQSIFKEVYFIDDEININFIMRCDQDNDFNLYYHLLIGINKNDKLLLMIHFENTDEYSSASQTCFYEIGCIDNIDKIYNFIYDILNNVFQKIKEKK